MDSLRTYSSRLVALGPFLLVGFTSSSPFLESETRKCVALAGSNVPRKPSRRLNSALIKKNNELRDWERNKLGALVRSILKRPVTFCLVTRL